MPMNIFPVLTVCLLCYIEQAEQALFLLPALQDGDKNGAWLMGDMANLSGLSINTHF